MLLIDEIDRADDEFEAFLLEVLSDFQISIPEIGTIKAQSPPLVVLTSNRTRELHDALKRRCLYHWIGYPAAEREVEIVLIREPGVPAALARKVVAAVHRLRELDLAKPPGVAETIDWARTLDFLGETDLQVPAARWTPSGPWSRTATTWTWSATTWRRSPPVPDPGPMTGSPGSSSPSPASCARPGSRWARGTCWSTARR